MRCKIVARVVTTGEQKIRGTAFSDPNCITEPTTETLSVIHIKQVTKKFIVDLEHNDTVSSGISMVSHFMTDFVIEMVLPPLEVLPALFKFFCWKGKKGVYERWVLISKFSKIGIHSFVFKN